MCPVNVIKVKQAAGSVKISFKDATLVEKNYLTPDTLELKFNTKNFKFKPGQYISLQGNDSL
jgi:NAD(P)H-flavin reductase